MTTIINLTPHIVTLRLADDTDLVFPASGTVARVATVQTPCAHITNLPAATRSLGDVTGIPDDDRFCIVSTMVFDASAAAVTRAELEISGDGEFCLGARDRFDALYARHRRLLVPDSGADAIRDEKGQIVAVRRFIVTV